MPFADQKFGKFLGEIRPPIKIGNLALSSLPTPLLLDSHAFGRSAIGLSAWVAKIMYVACMYPHNIHKLQMHIFQARRRRKYLHDCLFSLIYKF